MMHATYAGSMSTVQIRNVPEELSRELKARAARAGTSLSDYLLTELTQLVARPSVEELSARIERSRVADLTPAADILAEERARR